jgi:hypothetical protein
VATEEIRQCWENEISAFPAILFLVELRPLLLKGVQRKKESGKW